MTAAAEPPRNQPDHRHEPAPPELRASDADREEVVNLLSEHAAAGRISLAELEERVGLAYAAKTHPQLAELTRDLPVTSTPPPLRQKISRWFVAVLGGSNRRGTQRMSGSINVIAVLGGDDIDLREAEIEGGELTINVYSCLGGPNIYLPDSVEVEVSGVAILGGNDEHGSLRRPRPGAPLIRIRSHALLGGAEVWRLPAEARGMRLKDARRTAKALRRSGDS